MEAERYAGERRALYHFLSELRPLVLAELGRDSLLYHRIDRALRWGDLGGLRDARRAFHNQPAALKRRLLQGLLDPTGGAEPRDGRRPPEGHRARRPLPPGVFIRFEASAEPWRTGGEGLVISVLSPRRQAADEGGEGHPVQVLVRPGTLPRAAAVALRAIADRIEGERRLLSSRYWERAGDARGAEADGGGTETADQA